MATHGGRYDFDDGGTYLGTWEEGKAHGYGSCTGPKGLGEFAGLWQAGFESSGIYAWPSGNMYEGQWQNGKRHGLGIETKGKWIYRGEWSMGFKGRHGVRSAAGTGAKYEGGYTSGIQEGYGVETYADGGYYSGQFNRGCRHGFGVRKSPPFSVLAQFLKDKTIRASLTSLRSVEETEEIVKQREKHLEEVHGGFVLMTIQPSQMLIDAHQLMARKARKAGESGTFSRRPLFARLRKQHSVSDVRGNKDFKTLSVRSAVSANESDSILIENNLQRRLPKAAKATHGHYAPSANHRPQLDQTLEPDTYIDPNVVEIYSGQWKADKRTGYGVCERSDGLKYEGELFNNMRHGCGMTTFANGMQECGRYKNNVLTEWSDAGRGKITLFSRGSKLRDKVDEAVKQARGAAQMAVQISDVARSIQTMARQKADAADQAASKARHDRDIAKKKKAEFLMIYPDKRAVTKGKFSLFPPVQAALSSAMGCALHPGEEGRLYTSARGNHPSIRHHDEGQSSMLPSDDPQATFLSLGALLGNTHEPAAASAVAAGSEPEGNSGDPDAQQLPRRESSGAIVNDFFSHYSTLKDSASTSTSSTGISSRSRMTTLSSAPSSTSTGYGSATVPRGDSIEDEAADIQTHNAQFAGSQQSTAISTKGKVDGSLPVSTNRRASLSNIPAANGTLMNGRPSRLMIQVSKLSQQTEEVDSEQERDMSVEPPVPSVRLAAGKSPVHTIISDRSLPLNHVVKRTTTAANGDQSLSKDILKPATNVGTKEKNRSIPDLHTCESMKQHVMPREEAYRLGHARRQELMEERLQNGEVIVIRIGTVKRWFLRHIVILVAFLLNIALIFWLASLLPSNETNFGDETGSSRNMQREEG